MRPDGISKRRLSEASLYTSIWWSWTARIFAIRRPQGEAGEAAGAPQGRHRHQRARRGRRRGGIRCGVPQWAWRASYRSALMAVQVRPGSEPLALRSCLTLRADAAVTLDAGRYGLTWPEDSFVSVASKRLRRYRVFWALAAFLHPCDMFNRLSKDWLKRNATMHKGSLR